MYTSPNCMLSRVRSVKHFFWGGNALSRAHRGVLVPTSLWLGSIDSLPFATVVFWLHLKTKTKFKEKHGKKTPLSTLHCILARHALKLICQTTFDSILFKSCHYWAMRVSCLVVTSRRSRDQNAGFWDADDADLLEASWLFSFKSILSFTYLRKMSIYQTNSVYVKLYSYSTK